MHNEEAEAEGVGRERACGGTCMQELSDKDVVLQGDSGHQALQSGGAFRSRRAARCGSYGWRIAVCVAWGTILAHSLFY